MKHVVLLGDSIFDNQAYVPDESPVIEQLRMFLPTPWQATLLAVDGHVTRDVIRQTRNLPIDASHLVVSCGGNDALRFRSLLEAETNSAADLLLRLTDARAIFKSDYRAMLSHILSLELPTAVCTIYDSVPGLDPNEVAGLGILNEVILREAAANKIPVVDLRLICADPSDYSLLSPIEPSSIGGEKIAFAISHLVSDYDSFRGHCVIYT